MPSPCHAGKLETCWYSKLYEVIESMDLYEKEGDITL